ncbi:protein TolR [Litorivicinus lipolyticus]|uniref:Tol-Pal system protein TolR n=1 Tax=Litorivicinus lipolyticus TaxID=418701 RepID=A0A5Q2QDS1_9GAMM|nr:protein TolR [Litorivicinus lipolyticus]QGG80000.1 protein TolR [Litorivicinus lipolyticus]
MRQGGRRRNRMVAEINVVPYIDVMLVLLVIFMVTAPLLEQGVEVALPETASEPLPIEPNQEPVIVSVDADGLAYLNVGQEDQAIDLATLQDQVAKIVRQRPDVQVTLRGDGQVSYQVIMQVMSALQAAGAKNLGLVSKAP